MNNDVWLAMVEESEKLLIGSVKPNKTLVEEALSFDASMINLLSDDILRKYIVVLGQYLIYIQFEENSLEAACLAWERALDSSIHRVLLEGGVPSEVKTVAAKRSWVIDNNEDVIKLNAEYVISQTKRQIVKNLAKPIEQYINTLKRELGARYEERNSKYV